ncbi:MAG: DoxX family membrane protein [Proteobacteria bacterium]|nr:MAG: DoxX family membrane protein [Pseudomonadota bacterium]
MGSSRMQRISPDKRMIAILVYLTACLQVIGYSYLALESGSTLAQYLVLHSALDASYTVFINQAVVGLMVLGLVLAFFRWSPWPFYLIGGLFLLEAIFRTLVGGEISSTLAIPGDCARYLWFLAIGFALRSARTLDVEVGLPSVRLLLRFGLALTFITHGIEALLKYPGFVAAITQVNQTLLPAIYSESLTNNLLVVIGVVDVMVGLLVLFRPSRTALVYMAVWGGLTALSRVAISPYEGMFEAMIRAPHFMLPLLIMIIEGQRTLRKPIRRVYTSTMKRIGFAHSPWAWKRSSHEG